MKQPDDMVTTEPVTEEVSAPPKLYAHRDPSKLEPYYSQHVSAMTTEGLHAKSHIAAELAWRDQELERLRARVAEQPADVIYCQGCGDGLEPEPVPTLCVGCVNEALQRGVDPDPEELRAARIEQGPL